MGSAFIPIAAGGKIASKLRFNIGALRCGDRSSHSLAAGLCAAGAGPAGQGRGGAVDEPTIC